MEKGILTKEVEKLLAELADKKVKAGIFEVIDGAAFNYVIKFLDDNYGDKIPEEYRLKLRDLIHKVLIDGDVDGAIDVLLDYIDDLIDIPILDDEDEDALFKGLAHIVKGLVLSLTKKNDNK